MGLGGEDSSGSGARKRVDDARITVLTGAGISCESGIPTFRGPGGLWAQGGADAMARATRLEFGRQPLDGWRWHWELLEVCRTSVPHEAHLALVELELALGDRFRLVTQNVDGLHLAAGNRRVHEVHGSLHRMRCLGECGAPGRPPPLCLELEQLHCGGCGGWMRPSVLWFDEFYDDVYCDFTPAMAAVVEADILLVIGTSGSTTFPALALESAESRGIPVIDVNPADGPFRALAAKSPGGFVVQGAAGRAVPEVVRGLLRG